MKNLQKASNKPVLQHALNQIHGCDGRLMAKFLKTATQVDLCCHLPYFLVPLGYSVPNSPKFSLLKTYVINLRPPSQPFFGHYLFYHGFLVSHTLFHYILAV